MKLSSLLSFMYYSSLEEPTYDDLESSNVSMCSGSVNEILDQVRKNDIQNGRMSCYILRKLKIYYISKISTNKLFHFIWMILSVSSKHFKDVAFALVAALVLKLLLYPEIMPLAVGGISSYEIHNCRKVLIRGIWI